MAAGVANNTGSILQVVPFFRSNFLHIYNYENPVNKPRLRSSPPGYNYISRLKLLDVPILYESVECEIFQQSFETCQKVDHMTCTHSHDVIVECVHRHQVA